jgi:2-polyprenyl-3-methyl-5-hydroxy-6-metoxy-1,4-benzoquinol methylase
MNPADPPINPWDAAAEAYGRHIAQREATDLAQDALLSRMLELLGDLSGLDVLDAGCGEGFLSRVLAAHGAHVTGIDLSPRLIAMARAKDPDHTIAYHNADLSQSLPAFAEHFDRIGSHLVLNDVANLRGFAATLASVARPGARAVLALNNPYSAIVRGHITDYFAPGQQGTYRGLAQEGVQAQYYHRSLEEYLDAFLSGGFRLTRLADVTDQGGLPGLLPAEVRFPRFVILAFDKPLADRPGNDALT